MRKGLITFGLFFFFLAATAFGQEKRYALYSVAFYNLENLFDTIHDEGKNDYEYLPDGANQWNAMKYKSKLHNMAEVISKLSTDKLPMGPVIIGMAEVENKRVLEDLLKQPSLSERGYKYVHHEGRDQRGIDCALLYNPSMFTLTGSKLIPYTNKDGSIYDTRGFLVVSGTLADETIHVIVNHWPSRAATSPARERAGEQVRAIKDSLMNENSAAKIIIMGDMNDDPMDKSLAVSLGAKRKQADVGQNELYNPWWDTLKKGHGTLLYQGKWNLFDQIIVSGNLLGSDRSSLKYFKNEIFNRDFMFQKEGKYKGYPKRTQAGGVWTNGYSDHLPTMIYLIKEVK